MRRLLGQIGLGFAAWITMSAPAAASATVTCGIDDKFIAFEMQATSGRSGPITYVQGGTIRLKPASGHSIPAISFDYSHIMQQWLLGQDLRLQIEVTDERQKQTIGLVILARRNRDSDTYRGGYVLTVFGAGKTAEFKGRIKDCVAG